MAHRPMMTFEDHRALSRSTPYSYLVMSPDLTIIAASRAYLCSVRRAQEEIVGRYVFDAFLKIGMIPVQPTV